MVCKLHATPISRKIGTAFENAARISAENTVAEDVAMSAVVKLFEADGGTDNG
jgi:energy-coupling factor transporter ATP-binding protein EcfA2